MSATTKTLMRTDGRSGYESAAMIQALRALETALGYAPGTLTITQFGYMAATSYSGSTHGKDAADLSYYEYAKKSRYGRLLGLWVAPRTVADGGGSWSVAHCHVGLIGGGANSTAMNAQITEYLAGGDGLSGSIADRNWRPRYPNIKFVYGATRARWIASKDTKGYSQPGGNSADVKVARLKGFVWPERNLATVRVRGADGTTVEWLVSDTLTFYRKSDFNLYVPGFVSLVERWTVAKEPCYGRVAPGDSAIKVTRSIGYAIKTVGYVVLGGVKYVMTEFGTWYHAASLKPVTTTTSTAPTSVNLTVASQNSIVNRLSPVDPPNISNWTQGETWAKRAILQAAMLKDRSVSVLATQEAGRKEDVAVLDAALNGLGGGTWADKTWGDGWDISQAVIWNTAAHKLIGSQPLTMSPAGPGSSHNIANLTHLQHTATGIDFYVCTVHLISGASETNETDRGRQVKSLVPQVEAITGTKAVLYVGDFNSAKGRLGDAVAAAFASFGIVDAEDTDCAAVNGEFDSFNSTDNPPRKASIQIDRAFAKAGQIKFRLREVLVDLDSAGNHQTPWPSDHQPVLWEITVYRK